MSYSRGTRAISLQCWNVRSRCREMTVALALSVLLAGCGKVPSGQVMAQPSLDWKEDVLLPDGRVVVLKRHLDFNGLAQEPLSARGPGYSWFEFVNPDSGENVRWTDEGDLTTVALVVWQREPFLLVIPTYGRSFRKFGCPNPQYLVFRYKDYQWARQELARWPVATIRANVTSGGGTDMRSNLTRYNNHLPTSVTQASVVLNNKPWIIRFEGMPAQTFGTENCLHESSLLLDNGDN